MASEDDWGPVPTDSDEIGVPEAFQAEYAARLAIAKGKLVKVSLPPSIDVYYDESAKWSVLGKTAIPVAFMALVNDPRYPGCVLDLVADERGNVTFDRISFVRRPDDPPLQVAKIRAPLDNFRRDAAGVVAAEITELRDDGTLVMRRGPTTIDAFTDDFDKVVRRGSQRGRKTSDDTLQETADIYRAAVAAGRHPAPDVAAKWSVTPSHARKMIGLARKRGFLGEAIPRRVGEQPPPPPAPTKGDDS
jgi:hypothetical protein